MTTSPVMGITEEILGEIERAGWKLVPVESTVEMEDAGCKAASRLMGMSEAGRVYRAMLASAPAAPVAQEPAAWPAAAHDLVRDWQTGMASSNEVCIALASALYAAPPAAEQPDAWTPSGADYDRNIHRNPDAAAWADLFVATFPGLADKHDLMLGCFANAMMAMHDFLKSEQPDTVAVPRELLKQACSEDRTLRATARFVLRSLLGKEGEA